MSRISERALPTLVAELADFDVGKRTAVLDSLDPAQRERVVSLLDRHPRRTDAAKSVNISGLSPWLAELIESKGNMAPRAHRALRDCAARLFTVEAPSKPPRGSSLLGCIGAALISRKPK